MINKKVIVNILGYLLMIEAMFMFLSMGVAFIYGEGDAMGFLFSGLITLAAGALLYLGTPRTEKQIGKRDGYIIVSLVWVIFSLFGCIPYLWTGSITNFTDAFFETISGFTTTGSSILNDIESLPHGILFWRSITQWMGGMGIIVLTIAILPVLGIGGMQLFAAEVPGPTPDKLHPKIRETAKRLWAIYTFYTGLEALLLWIGGMPIFDAICHSFTTMATGGYSTKQDSIAHWDSPFIHYVIIFFMILAGMNFTLSYFGMHLRFKKVFRNEELRWYIGFIILFAFIVMLVLNLHQDLETEASIRNALFQVVSIMTTTGYVTADYLSWIPFLGYIILLLMFIGGSTGSTGGSIKIMRIVMVIKNSYYEMKRLIHPQAIIPVRYNGHAVSSQILSNILAFISIYILTFAVSVIIMSTMVPNMDTAMGSVATTLGNVGPGLGSVGPMHNFYHMPTFGKWYLSFLMLIGRLELFTVLILFTPSFWKN
jgi:trk system potassium uptake protein TrkH